MSVSTEEEFDRLANDLARVMSDRGLSTLHVAEEAHVTVDDVRSVLAGGLRFVEGHVLARMDRWVIEQSATMS